MQEIKNVKFNVKKVFIAGGTGFLGYYSALQFLKLGVKVDTIALPNEINLGDWFPAEINKQFGNLFEMSEDAIYDILKDRGYDTFIYGLGPDDRVTPPAPAYDFFKLRLVDYATKICRAAKRAGIRRCVVMNSYFAFFDREAERIGLKPGDLSKYHPYIKVRVEQSASIRALGETGKFDVMIMELPYIFGNMPGRTPLWKNVFLDRFEKMPAIFFPRGGTNMIHVKGIAESIVAAAFNGDNGECYPVGNENWKYKDMINTMMKSVGNKKRFFGMPAWICYFAGISIKRAEKKHGKEGGLDYARLMTQIQSRNLYFDPNETRQKLRYDSLGFTGGGSVADGIAQTMRACYPEKYNEDGSLK